MVGFNRRFSPHVARLRELTRDRRGPLVLNYRVLADPSPPSDWIYSTSGGGRIIGEACHMFDVFNFLVGSSVALLEADVIAPPPGCGGPTSDTVICSFRYSDGSLCSLTYTALGRKSTENGKERVEAMWDRKSFVIQDFTKSDGSGCTAGAIANKRSKGHFEELEALADFLRGRGPEPISLNDCIRATRMSFQVDAACRQVAAELSPETAFA